METFTRLIVILPPLTILLAGCGGGALSQNDMRKMALSRRSSDDEDQDKLIANANANANAGPAPVLPTPRVPAAVSETATAVADEGQAPQHAAAAIVSAPGQPFTGAATEESSSTTTASASANRSDEQRRQITIDNLTAIGAALERYLQDRGNYPPQFLADANGQPLLSWRVALLPYLGYQELYQRFQLNEAWTSPANRALLNQIPTVYQSPERLNSSTNYLAITHTTSALFGGRGRLASRFEDGIGNTMFVAEVDDDLAVPWTQPDDLNFDKQNPRRGLGGLRQDGFFALWGGGAVYRAAPGTSDSELNAAVTLDGGERVLFKAVRSLPQAQVDVSLAAAADTGDGAVESRTALAPRDRQTGLTPTLHPSDEANAGSQGPPVMAPREAQQAFTEGREQEAAERFFASILAGEASNNWPSQFRWIPALRRPAAIVRYGIGVDFTSPRAAAAKRAANAPDLGQRTADIYRQLTGDFGEAVLHLLQQHPVHAPFLVEESVALVPAGQGGQRRGRQAIDADGSGSGSGTPGPKGTLSTADKTPALLRPKPHRLLAPVVQFTAVGKENYLLRLAERLGIDVLVVFEIDERNTRGGWNRDIRLAVYDAAREERIFRTKRFNTVRMETAQADLIEEDPAEEAVAAFREFLATKLQPTALPGELSARHVEARVAQLSARQLENPMGALAEVRLYHELQLLEIDKLLEAYRRRLNEAAALQLFGGNSEQKKRALEPWLPKPRL